MADSFRELIAAISDCGVDVEVDLAEYVLNQQALEFDIEPFDIKCKINKIADSMIEAIRLGKNSDELSASGLSGKNAALVHSAEVCSLIPDGLVSDFQKKVVLYSLAVIEQNARMGKIAACPTAGSSGILPAVLVAAYEDFNKSRDELIDSLIVAGEIGRIISLKMQLAGAVAGCQAECGVASAMAAGALAYIFGSNIDTIFNAVALCLKNLLGLTCDPVAGLVEIPCVKRNALLASYSVTAVYLAMAGVESKIPVDEVVDAMKETGILMSPKLKESSEAGLAVTKTGCKIKSDLQKLWQM